MDYKQVLYLLLVLTAFLLGCMRWRKLHKPDKILTILLSLTLVQEALASLFEFIFGNNMFTYHIYSPVEFFMLCWYFNESNLRLKKYNGGIIIGITGVVAGILNTLFFQPLTMFNSYYLLFEGTIIIILCLYSLCDMFLAETLEFTKLPYFWITITLLFYWSTTYTGWGVINLLEEGNNVFFKSVRSILYLSNIVLYAIISIVFFNYKDRNPAVR